VALSPNDTIGLKEFSDVSFFIKKPSFVGREGYNFFRLEGLPVFILQDNGVIQWTVTDQDGFFAFPNVIEFTTGPDWSRVPGLGSGSGSGWDIIGDQPDYDDWWNDDFTYRYEDDVPLGGDDFADDDYADDDDWIDTWVDDFEFRYDDYYATDDYAWDDWGSDVDDDYWENRRNYYDNDGRFGNADDDLYDSSLGDSAIRSTGAPPTPRVSSVDDDFENIFDDVTIETSPRAMMIFGHPLSRGVLNVVQPIFDVGQVNFLNGRLVRGDADYIYPSRP